MDESLSEEQQIVLPAVQQNSFWIAVIVYLCILMVGAVSPLLGILGLALLAIIALFRIIARNFNLLVILVAFGLLTAVVPFLLIIYIPVLIYFFIMRLEYLFQHFMLVLVGLFIYFFPIGTMAASMEAPSSAVLLIVPAIAFPLFLKYFVDTKEYTVQKALEIMSEAPVLIVSIVLPFLKLGIGVEATGSPEPIAGDTVAGDAVAKPMVNEVANMRTNPIYSEAFVSEAPITEPYAATLFATNSAVTLSGFFHHLQQSQQIDNADGTTSLVDNSGYQQVKISNHGFDSIFIKEYISYLKITDSHGDTLGFIKQVGNDLEIRDATMHKIGNVTAEGDDMNIVDTFGVKVASIPDATPDTSLPILDTDIDNSFSYDTVTVEDTIGDDTLDSNNSTSLTKDEILIKDEKLHGEVTAQEERPDNNALTSSTHSTLLVILASLIATKKENTSVKPTGENPNYPQHTPIDSNQNGFIDNLAPYPEDSFYAFIIKHASADFRSNDCVYMDEKIRDKAVFSATDIAAIEEKFGVSQNEMLLIIDDAIMFKARTGVILTKDSIYVKEVLFESKCFPLRQFERFVQASVFQSEAKLKDNALFIHLTQPNSKKAYKELISLYQRYQQS